MNTSDNTAWQAVGGRLRAARLALQLTAQPFASRLGISRGYLSELENGKRQISAKVLDALAREFAVNRLYVTDGAEPMLDVKKLTSDPPVFFAPRGKQVALSAAPTHLNRAEEKAPAAFFSSTGTSFAPPIIAMVIAEVLRSLAHQRLELEPEKAAELIMLIHDDIVDGMSDLDQVTQQQVTTKTQRLMRLVA